MNSLLQKGKNMKRVIILNRWDDELSEYHRYIDHTKNKVAYITTKAGKFRLSPELAVVIDVLDQLVPGKELEDALMRSKTALDDRVDHILCLSEFDLLTGAWAREFLGVKGYGIEQVLRFRDKTAMKNAILKSGLNAPNFVSAEDDGLLNAFVENISFPVIAKPKCGAASAGCAALRTKEELFQFLEDKPRADYEVEEFVDGPIYHVDGLVFKGEIFFVKAWRYIGTCLGFASGSPLGSVMIESGSHNDQLTAFSEQCLRALGHDNGCFHLELIENHNGLYFLEIGARVGGGEIPFIIKDLFDIDFVQEWIRIELGMTPLLPPPKNGVIGGFLMIPEPKSAPVEVIERTSLIGRIPNLYHEILPHVGSVLDGKGGYDKIAGRFHFCGSEEYELEEAIAQAKKHYQLTFAPLPR